MAAHLAAHLKAALSKGADRHLVGPTIDTFHDFYPLKITRQARQIGIYLPGLADQGVDI